MLEELFINILAELVTVVIFVVTAILFYRVTRRSKLHRFFGLHTHKKVIIFMSNLNNRPSGNAGPALGNARFYSGPAIPYFEIIMVPPLLRLFNVIVPGFGELPNAIKGLTLSDIDVKYKASPNVIEHLHIPSHTTVFSFGGPNYNEVSRYIQEKLQPRMILDETGGQVLERKNGRLISAGKSVSIVQKVYDRTREQWFFYIAGIDAHGTKGALYYLIKNWNRLYHKYDDREFSICLEFPWSGKDRDSYKCPRVVKRIVKHQKPAKAAA